MSAHISSTHVSMISHVKRNAMDCNTHKAWSRIVKLYVVESIFFRIYIFVIIFMLILCCLFFCFFYLFM